MAAPATVSAALESLSHLLGEVFHQDDPEWLTAAKSIWDSVQPIRAVAVTSVWHKPWIVLGRDTFGGDVLRRLGVENAYGEHAERYPRPKLPELQERFSRGEADLLVLPDEPYAFTHDDGPEDFVGIKHVLVSGRYLTWYGPSLVDAHRELSSALDRVLEPG